LSHGIEHRFEVVRKAADTLIANLQGGTFEGVSDAEQDGQLMRVGGILLQPKQGVLRVLEGTSALCDENPTDRLHDFFVVRHVSSLHCVPEKM
jgi:hypothetical protein